MVNRMYKRGLVVGIIILFVGVGIQPAFAVDIPEKEEIEPKDYLFETFIEIANNPDIKELFEKYGNNIYDLDYNYKGIFLKILFNNPKLLFSELFTKPKFTSDYLNFAFNQGCELVDVIGKEKALEMIKSVKFTNPEIVDEFQNIVLNDKELSNRITTLAELNEESWEDTPIICFFLVYLLARSLIRAYFFLELHFIFFGDEEGSFFVGIAYLYFQMMAIGLILGLEFDCIESPPNI